ncbi:VWA domain-containing protein [Stutzerimonas xanthomarina]|uniref:VWA domain-containing protein n=1 Tax=Stutzerimonas xanthomarina TaxID=271420 RepID=UPI0029A61C98|nr:VWA domain-containing protein [Stutzerimonas xanthomarina]MDX2352406.1 VWA domain-containing protein [Stutzerimonas xanthomarina]
MSELLPYLLRPFWLIVLPLPIWLMWRLWHRQRQTGRWQRLLPEAFHTALLTRGKLRNSKLPWILLGSAWLLGCLALLGPSWQQVEQPSLTRADPLVILLETTPAMLATDVRPSRLDQAKRKILDLLQTRQDAQTAVVVFAGSAHTLVPMSNDMATTQNLLDALQPDLMPEPGHRADLAVMQGIDLLLQGANGAGRLLLIGSSLSEPERASIEQQLEENELSLLLLGIGTEQGAPIPLEDGSFLKDDKGSIVIPRLDDNAMRRFASQIGGRYQQARVDDADLRNLGLLERNGKLVAQDETTRLDAWQDQGYWLLLPLVLLAAFAGRRGWLFCLPLVLFVPQPASALSFDDLWLRPDQQGMRLLESSRPGEAATRFEDHRWQGYARYQAGDFAGAAEQFGKGDSAADHYNRGNALARNDELQAAIEAYEQALELDPGLDVARRNKTTVEEALRQKEAQADADPDASPPQESTSEAEQRKQPRGSKAPDTSSDSTDQTTAQAPPEPAGEVSSETLNEGPPESEPVATEQQMAQAQEVPVDPEQDQAMNQWLRKIPDDPGELLRRKFLYEQRKRQELNQ